MLDTIRVLISLVLLFACAVLLSVLEGKIPIIIVTVVAVYAIWNVWDEIIYEH